MSISSASDEEAISPTSSANQEAIPTSSSANEQAIPTTDVANEEAMPTSLAESDQEPSLVEEQDFNALLKLVRDYTARQTPAAPASSERKSLAEQELGSGMLRSGDPMTTETTEEAKALEETSHGARGTLQEVQKPSQKADDEPPIGEDGSRGADSKMDNKEALDHDPDSEMVDKDALEVGNDQDTDNHKGSDGGGKRLSLDSKAAYNIKELGVKDDQDGKLKGYCSGYLINREGIRHGFHALMAPLPDTKNLFVALFDRWVNLRPEFCSHPVKKGTGVWGPELNNGSLLLVCHLYVYEEYRQEGRERRLFHDLWAKARNVAIRDLSENCLFALVRPGCNDTLKPKRFWKTIKFTRIGSTEYFGIAKHPSRS